MKIPNENLIKPFSPEHYAYFLGWLYQCEESTKEKVWKKIISGNYNYLEFNEFSLTIDHINKTIISEPLYYKGKNLSYFSSEKWELKVFFNDFKQLIGLYELDYDNYFKVIENLEFALELLQLNEYKLLLRDDYKMIKSEILNMKKSMDLNEAIPTFHTRPLFNVDNDFLCFLYQLAIDYIKFSKPIDIISQSEFGITFTLGYD